MRLAARSLRRIIPAVSSTAAVPPPKVPSAGASGRLAAAPVELPDMSIPGMSAGMLAVGSGVGVLPDMSIPGMSAGMLAGLVGVGELSDPTAIGTTAALSGVAADASWCDVSINDPRTAVAATVAPTDATTKRRRHVAASPVSRMFLVSISCSIVLLIEKSVQPSRVMARAWAVITAQVFSMTLGSVPGDFPSDLYEGFVKFLQAPQSSCCRRTLVMRTYLRQTFTQIRSIPSSTRRIAEAES